VIAEIDSAALNAVGGGDAATILMLAPPAVVVAAFEAMKQALEAQSGSSPDGN
jgi:hypothetical protein